MPEVQNTLGGLAEAVDVLATPWPSAWLVAVGVFALVWFGRRRLPAGVGEGLFVTALSGALLATYLPPRGSEPRLLWLCVVLTSLAVLWHVAARWVERGTGPRANSPAVDSPVSQRAARQLVGGQAVVLCGLLTVGAAFSSAADSQTQRLGVTTCLVLLFALALRRYLDRAGPLSRYAVLALLGGALWQWVPWALVRPRGGLISLTLLSAGAAALVGALLPIWQHWQHRRRVWRTQPEQLADPPAQHPALLRGVTAISTLVGLGGLLVPDLTLTPLAVALAAAAALIVAHRRPGNGASGQIGLALLGESVILAAVAWSPPAGVNALLGSALAAVYLLWLARFWQQQLHAGVAWTTAGRLIPVARELAYAAAFLCAALAAGVYRTAGPPDRTAAWPALVAALLLLLLGSMLVRDAAGRASHAAAFAACVVMFAATVPAQRLIGGFAGVVPWPVLAGGAGLLLALRVGPRSGEGKRDVVFDACIGGFLPVMALHAATQPGACGEGWVGPLVTGACTVSAIGLRWRRARLRPSDAEPEFPAGG